MAGCLVELYIWSIRGGYGIRDSNISCHVYHDKGDIVNTGYMDQKQQYLESRDQVWTPKNRRPDKLRDILKEAEELLTQHEVVATLWRSQKHVQLLLANCVVLSVQIATHSGDIDRLVIDRSLQGKVPGDITTAVMTSSFIMCTWSDKPKAAFIFFSKKPSQSGDSARKVEKLSSVDPKVSYVDLPGPKNRKLKRSLSVNTNQEWILVWWPSAPETSLQWAPPMAAEKDRANIVVFAVNGNKLEELCFIRTENDPIAVDFSLNQPRHIYTLEVAPGKSSIDTCIYECSKSRIQKAAVTSIPLKAPVLSYGRNHNEDKLILGCADCKLVLYNESKRITQFVQADLIPHFISWHPSDSVFIVGSSSGEMQCLDMALNSMFFYTLSEQLEPCTVLTLSSQFKHESSLQRLSWASPSYSWDSLPDAQDFILLTLTKGPLVLVQVGLGVLSRGSLGAQQLTKEYLANDQIDEAVHLLAALNWNTASSTCFGCLSAIMNHLLRLPLNPIREAALEASLGSFYVPLRPLSEVIVVEYRDAVSRLARRFFQLLLRYQRFEKAFLLAVDLHSRDLFMDIHHLAIDKGEMALATVAKQKAEEIELELPSTSGTDNYDSEDSLSDDVVTDGSYSSLEEKREGGGRGAASALQTDYRRAPLLSSESPRGRLPARNKSAEDGHAATRVRKSRLDVEAWHRAEERIDEAYRHGDANEDNGLVSGATGIAAIPGDIYTKVLTDNPFGWDPTEGATSPAGPAEHQGRDAENEEADDDKEEEETTTLKVVHFGMV
ncbi:WD repeat-containing and planar cell polarity effector protein fritz homolog [Diadema setosum]|uniref:WD repeat-containing and planar cell polarity effector protein fritz homolog n=1 Tax=Diadema setosum TaxID=31175 RepID=UPI003B3B72C3